VPRPVIPGKRLICSDAAVIQFADESVYANLLSVRQVGVPVVVVLVIAEQTIVWAYITLQIGIIRPSGVNHYAFGENGALRVKAAVIRKKQFVQIHCASPSFA